MSDTARNRRSRSRPTPARSAAPAGGAGEEDGPPTPARALFEDAERRPARGEAPPDAEPEPEESVLEAEGERWTVRVSGRSRTGSSTGAAPLLLLAFHRDGRPTPERESLVVGRSLSHVGEEALLMALQRAKPPREPGSRKEIFPELGGRKRDRDV